MRIAVQLPAGEVTVSAVLDRPDRPWAALALAHGAGAGMDHPFLEGMATGLRGQGIAVLRFAFPYREAGRRMPGPASHAIATWSAVFSHLSEQFADMPCLAAGKSYGGRMASMAAAEGVIAPAGLVYLGYPFHPPGKPDATRGEHLARIRAPQLFVEGSADPFIQPVAAFQDAVASCADAGVEWVDGGGHSFEAKGQRREPAAIGHGLSTRVSGWLCDRFGAEV